MTDEIQELHVADTNAIIWYLTNRQRLSPKALAIFEAAERGETFIMVSVISIAELYFWNQKHRAFTSFSELKQRLVDLVFFQFVAMNLDDIDDFDQDSNIPEMHDRIITGVARRLQAPLITSDLTIRASTIVTSVW